MATDNPVRWRLSKSKVWRSLCLYTYPGLPFLILSFPPVIIFFPFFKPHSRLYSHAVCQLHSHAVTCQVLSDAKFGHLALYGGLKCISGKFFLLRRVISLKNRCLMLSDSRVEHHKTLNGSATRTEHRENKHCQT